MTQRDTETSREHHSYSVTAEAENGEMCLQTNGAQDGLTPPEARIDKEGDFPRIFEGSVALRTS